MTMSMRMAAAIAFASCAPCAWAQSVHACPALPADAGLRWETLDGAGRVFCRALRDDGSAAFTVTISDDNPFRPRGTNRAEQASIAGRKARWYRSEIASDADAIAREALVELDDGKVAHLTLRAGSETQKVEAMRQVEALRFDGAGDARLSSN